MVPSKSAIKKKTNTINLETLKKGALGLTPALGKTFAEAAVVCLESQDHARGVALETTGDYKKTFSILWKGSANNQMIRSYSDNEVTTECGAYGISIVLIQKLAKLTVVQRSAKGTGFDFWLGKENEPQPLFQGLARLEVSGIRTGSNSDVNSRVNQKLKQTEKSDGLLPAYIVVIEFSAPQSKVVKKCNT